MKNQGFTLLEVIIAVFVVAVALTAIIEVFTLDTRSSLQSQKYLQAAVMAQSQMEEAVFNNILPNMLKVTIPWQAPAATGAITLVEEHF